MPVTSIRGEGTDRGRFKLGKDGYLQKYKFIKGPVMLNVEDAAALASFINQYLLNATLRPELEELDMRLYRELMDLVTKGSTEFRK